MWTYWPLFKYYLPLIFTGITPDIAEQALNRGITSSGSDKIVETLAAFGIAYSLLKVLGLTGALADVRHIGLVLVNSRQDRIKCMLFAVILSAITTTVQIIVGTTIVGTYYVEKLHNVTPDVSDIAKKSLLYMAGVPVLEGIAKGHEGMLLKEKHSILAAAGSLVDTGMQVVTTIILLQTPVKESVPILIPVLAVYSGIIARFIINVVCFYVKVYPNMKHSSTEKPATLMNLLCFWWPMALVTSVQRISRPVINVFIARFEPDPKAATTQLTCKLQQPLTICQMFCFWWPLAVVKTEHKITRPVINVFVARAEPDPTSAAFAIAVLAVTYPVAHVFYAVLNDLKSVVPPFLKRKDGTLDQRGIHSGYTAWQLAIFSGAIGLCSLTLMFLVFYIPGGTIGIMTNIIGTSMEMALLCVIPLQIYAVFPIPVTIRGFLTGWLMAKKETKFIAPSAIIRIVFVIASLFVFPQISVHGAPMGVAALLTGFVVESITVAIGSLIVHIKRKIKFTGPPDQEMIDLPGDYNPKSSQLDVRTSILHQNGDVPTTSVKVDNNYNTKYAEVDLVIGSNDHRKLLTERNSEFFSVEDVHDEQHKTEDKFLSTHDVPDGFGTNQDEYSNADEHVKFLSTGDIPEKFSMQQ